MSLFGKKEINHLTRQRDELAEKYQAEKERCKRVLGDFRRRTMPKSHLVARHEHVLCTRCFETEPVHCGSGTPMDTLIMAYENLAARHQDCAPEKKDG